MESNPQKSFLPQCPFSEVSPCSLWTHLDLYSAASSSLGRIIPFTQHHHRRYAGGVSRRRNNTGTLCIASAATVGARVILLTGGIENIYAVPESNQYPPIKARSQPHQGSRISSAISEPSLSILSCQIKYCLSPNAVSRHHFLLLYQNITSGLNISDGHRLGRNSYSCFSSRPLILLKPWVATGTSGRNFWTAF